MPCATKIAAPKSSHTLLVNTYQIRRPGAALSLYRNKGIVRETLVYIHVAEYFLAAGQTWSQLTFAILFFRYYLPLY